MCVEYPYRLNSNIYHAVCRIIFISTLTITLLFTLIPKQDRIQTSRISI